jgi:ureidoglycolate lyase
MKLLRYGPVGQEKPGLLDKGGTIRDLSGIIADISGGTLDAATLSRIAATDPASLPAVSGSPRIGPCVANPSKFVCVGLNYSDHAAETNLPIPSEPILFIKALS